MQQSFVPERAGDEAGDIRTSVTFDNLGQMGKVAVEQVRLLGGRAFLASENIAFSHAGN